MPPNERRRPSRLAPDAGILDNATTSRLFTVNSWSGQTSSSGPTSGTPVVNPVSGALPTVSEVSPHEIGEDGDGDVTIGGVEISLVWANEDPNGTSPMNYLLSPNALVITATTSTG
jgi:hypothetical protein